MIGVIIGDCLDAMPAMPDSSVDAVVCDPPYNLTAGKRGGSGVASVNLDSPYGRARIGTGNGGGFMGQAWDGTGVAFDPATWVECLRVLKPGGHLLAFGGTRTYHRLACAVEDAGFEIRDCLAWLYGSGFPKSLNVGKAIDKPYHGPVCEDGWITPDARAHQGEGTALKPAFEPIAFARKPLIGTVAANVLAHSTGALHVDACRIATTDSLGGGAELDVQSDKPEGWDRPWRSDSEAQAAHAARVRANVQKAEALGRWPANVLLDPEAAALLDEQAPNTGGGGFPSSGNGVGDGPVYGKAGPNFRPRGTGRVDANAGASRFFYCAKASSKERNAGLDERNGHPTVKPVELMRWLVRLVTPPGGLVIDPFAGSGTTGIACTLEGLNFIGIEREADYVEIARARIAHWGLPS